MFIATGAILKMLLVKRKKLEEASYNDTCAETHCLFSLLVIVSVV